jgi:dTDP-4-amino-4,6-dideoxygalactose transaminase
VAKKIIHIAQPKMGKEEWEALKAPLESGWLTQGPQVGAFEKLFAEKHEVKHALAVSNCTTALHLSLLALGIGEGDEVIVPSFTWVSTANAVLYCRATPVFIDIETATFNLDITQLRNKISTKTKAIIAVHLFGLCVNINAIKQAFPHLKIIEDAACAAGAGYFGRPAGGLGNIGCFSFHPRKSITTGEGGMITTNDDALAEMINMLRNHGASVSEEQRHLGPKPYRLAEYNLLGYNYRMTDLQGAVGLVQLKKLEGFINERNEWANYYSTQLKDIPWLLTPGVPEGYKHGWQSYVLMIDESRSPMKRNEIMERLMEKGVSTRPGTHAVHMLGYYATSFHINPSDFPSSYAANEYSMSIPLHNCMSREDFEYVAESLKSL